MTRAVPTLSGSPEELKLVGARENNLKGIDLTLQHDKLVVVTGLSGSGKSTLAIDTIYAEGGRRYIETFSPYTRQFLDRLSRPDIDVVTGVRPALALEQRNRVTSSRSTVGTTTEINDYLKVLWTHLGELWCRKCEKPVRRDTPLNTQRSLLEELSKPNLAQLVVGFPLSHRGDATPGSVVAMLQAEGFLRFVLIPKGKRKSDGAEIKVQRIEELKEALENGKKAKAEDIIIVVDRFRADGVGENKALKDRLLSGINQSFTYGHGTLIAVGISAEDRFTNLLRFSEGLTCEGCGTTYKPPRPYMFSFNSPLGACDLCQGFGKVLAIDPHLIIPNQTKSIDSGAVACWSTDSTRHEFKKLKAACEERGIDTKVPWSKLSEADKDFVLNGAKAQEVKAKAAKFRGVQGWFDRLQQKRHKMHVRVFMARYRSEFECKKCHGTRLREEALNYRISGSTLPDVWRVPLDEIIPFFQSLIEKRSGIQECDIATEEVVSRLSYLVEIGLGYLTLDRQTRTLSGGESQRVNLTSILGARLVNTQLVLDEPTIGLHPSDTERLITAMEGLRDRGNSLMVVEHDPEVMLAADELIDIGPEAGAKGGEIVYQGVPAGIIECERSYTGRYLRDGMGEPFSGGLAAKTASVTPDSKRDMGGKRKGQKEVEVTAEKFLEIKGARAHNLCNVDISVPLGKLVVLTGVSGSGKSSLVGSALYRSYERITQGALPEALFAEPGGPVAGIEGLEQLAEIVLIDQSPVGKTPRSNPGTYTKAWDIIRDCLAETSAAESLGLSRSAFSFNVDGGRCPVCSGAGQIRIEMQFLADVFVECEACGGLRFQDKVLSVTYAGKSVIDLLQMSLDEVVQLFRETGDGERGERICELLNPLIDLGLGYLRLGHPLNELSGGEAQRLKLASYLLENPAGGSKKKTNSGKTLFILDEPTTGLHPYNVSQLLYAFSALLERGHSILVVEHNLDLIASADWIIDLGPGGGKSGGNLVAAGAPIELAKDHAKYPLSKTAALLADYLATDRRSKTVLKLKAAKAQTLKARALKNGVRKVANGAVSDKRTNDNARKEILVQGARHHNLKDISVAIPQNHLTVVTGVSGSGKSTLAFDIIFAEGQRRYIDCLSPYARQYIKQLDRADVDRVSGIPPTIAVSQRTSPPVGLSTVATTTELYQFLRLLYAKVGTQHCPKDGTKISSFSSMALAEELARRYSKERIFLFAPAVSGRKGYYNDLFQRAIRAEITEARVDGKIISLTTELRLERHKLHYISLLVGALSSPGRDMMMLHSAVEHALLLGGGAIEVAVGNKHEEPEVFSTVRCCPKCGQGYRELDPQDFSFRSARGVCGKCDGRGVVGEEDGPKKTCPECGGSRIGAIGRNVYVFGKRIDALTALAPQELLKEIDSWQFEERLIPVVEPIVIELKSRLELICSVGLDYLTLNREASSVSGGEAQRLRLAKTLGSPLTGVCYVLDEPSIGLHPQDQEHLMDTLLSLRDMGNTVIVVEHDEDMIRSAEHIVDIGPTGGADGGHVVVTGSVREVEACERSITGAMLRERTARAKDSKAEKNVIPFPAKKAEECLDLIGAKANNLKNVTASFPLGALTVVCGVSGAGKSSLVHGSLIPAVLDAFQGTKKKKKSEVLNQSWGELKNVSKLERLLEIDQSPPGKTSTSCPASFLGIFDDIRKLYAQLPEARTRGWSASHFSFNTGKGRCLNCSGKGYLRIPMSFLPEATAECEVCNGERYNEETESLTYQGISIGGLLKRTMSEAREILANHKSIRRTLDYVHELGLGYLTLGQPTHTLSGGETQRLKIARELGLREAVETLYVLDEPTIGLHMADVDKLVRVLFKLRDKGNTIVIIEHNLDVLRAADHLIEVGPGPGASGGKILFQGTPEKMTKMREMTPTKKFFSSSETVESSDKLLSSKRVNEKK